MEIQPLVFQVHKTLRSFFKKGGHYILAVSGGSDSMALCAACAELRKEGYRFSVCHVEHGLRGEEGLRDLELVRSFCEAKRLDFYRNHVSARAYAEKKHLSVEAAARELRMDALAKLRAALGADAAVFAHNQDDQAETVLLHLLRGSSLRGLGGMEADGPLGLHPLLEFTHRQLEEYCRLQGVPFCHDSTNDDLEITRNRVRHELLPYLARHFNPRIKETLARMAGQLQADEEFLSNYARLCTGEGRARGEILDGSCAHLRGGGAARNDSIICSESFLSQMQPNIMRRMLRSFYHRLAGRDLDYERTLAVESLLRRREGGKVVLLPGGVRVTFRNKKLIFQKTGEE